MSGKKGKKKQRGGRKYKDKTKKQIFDLNSKKLASEEGLERPWTTSEKYQANFYEKTYRLGLHSVAYPMSYDMLHTFCHEPLAASLQKSTSLTLTVVTEKHVLLVIDPCNAPSMREIWAQYMRGGVHVSSVEQFTREMPDFDCSNLQEFDTKTEKFQNFLRTNLPIKERLQRASLSPEMTLRDFLSLAIDGLFLGFFVADPESPCIDCKKSYKCACEERFPDLGALARHFFEIHKEFWDIAEDDFVLKTSQCKNCGYQCEGRSHAEKIHSFYRHYLEKHVNMFLDERRLKKFTRSQLEAMITRNMLEPMPIHTAPKTQTEVVPSLNVPRMVVPLTSSVGVAPPAPYMCQPAYGVQQTPGYCVPQGAQVFCVPVCQPQVYQPVLQQMAYVPQQPNYVPVFSQQGAYPQYAQISPWPAGYVPSQQVYEQAHGTVQQVAHQRSVAAAGCQSSPISTGIAPADRQTIDYMRLPDEPIQKNLPEGFPPYDISKTENVRYSFVRYSVDPDTPKTSDQRTRRQTRRSLVELKCSLRWIIESGTVLRTRCDGWSMPGKRTDRSVQFPRQDDSQTTRKYKGQKCKLEVSKTSEAAKRRRAGRAVVDADGLIAPCRIPKEEIASSMRFWSWIGATIDTRGIQLPSPTA